MRISAEGKVGIGLGLLAMAGGGAAVKWPTHDEIGIAMMAAAAIGGMLLAINHFGFSGRWRSFPRSCRQLISGNRGQARLGSEDRSITTEKMVATRRKPIPTTCRPSWR